MRRHIAKLSFSRVLVLIALMASSIHPVAALDEEPTCKLDQIDSDCIETQPTISDTIDKNRDRIAEELITLTDENFDELTWTSTPATWLIMFKTDACGICKKALPALEQLSVDPILAQHNENELQAQKDFVYAKEETVETGHIPRGPVYIATIDASWEGRDTTKRFGIDATPTIIVLRNEGYDDDMDDTRVFTTYRGQRAQYPLRNFVLGDFLYRKKSSIPPALTAAQSKPTSLFGRLFEIGKPYFAWVGKLLMAWFVFIGLLGLFMRVHNYAWNDNDEDYAEKAKTRQEEIEREFAQGKKEYKISQSKESEERQRKMMQKKMENRAKFAAKREARKKVQPIDGEEDDDDFVAVGVAVKKSDIKKDAGKSKGS
jgi:hypothetical protein